MTRNERREMLIKLNVALDCHLDREVSDYVLGMYSDPERWSLRNLENWAIRDLNRVQRQRLGEDK